MDINKRITELENEIAILPQGSIKHSNQIVPAQTKYLIDEEKLNQTKKRFGEIRKRCVLYRGEGTVPENGIEYQNVELFLKQL